MGHPIRWGILGYARIARLQVLPAMMETPNAVPYAIASRDPEKGQEAAKAFGFAKVYDNYQALLDDPDVDAVYIPLPNGLHKEWTLKAARAGKHVLCEKPLALTAADCREMVDVCRQQGVKLMEAFMYRFTTRTQKIQELLASGVIGELRHIHSNFSFHLTRPGDVRLDPDQGGGSFWDVGCYPINVIGMIMQDEPVSVCAQKVEVGGVDLAVSAVLKYKSGVICTANSGFDAASAKLTEITGALGSLVVRDTFFDTDTPILLVQDKKVTEIPVPACNRYVLELEEFGNAILEGREPSLDIEETVRNCGLIARILEEAK